MQASSHCSCVALVIATLVLQKLRGNASVACAVTTMLCCRCRCGAGNTSVFALLLSSSGHLCLCLWDNVANKDDRGDGGGRHANICSQKEREQHIPISAEEQKTRTKTTTVLQMTPPLRLPVPRQQCCIAVVVTARHGCSAGNASAFVLCCFCCCPAVFVSACRTTVPTMTTGAMEEAQPRCPREEPYNNHPATRAEKVGGGRRREH